jgi:hypothetical protein
MWFEARHCLESLFDSGIVRDALYACPLVINDAALLQRDARYCISTLEPLSMHVYS